MRSTRNEGGKPQAMPVRVADNLVKILTRYLPYTCPPDRSVFVAKNPNAFQATIHKHPACFISFIINAVV
jgi:hypothetical protein